MALTARLCASRERSGRGQQTVARVAGRRASRRGGQARRSAVRCVAARCAGGRIPKHVGVRALLRPPDRPPARSPASSPVRTFLSPAAAPGAAPLLPLPSLSPPSLCPSCGRARGAATKPQLPLPPCGSRRPRCASPPATPAMPSDACLQSALRILMPTVLLPSSAPGPGTPRAGDHVGRGISLGAPRIRPYDCACVQVPRGCASAPATSCPDEPPGRACPGGTHPSDAAPP